MKRRLPPLELMMDPNAGRNRRFAQGVGERGPHTIPRGRQVRNKFYRIFSVKAGMRVVHAESGLEAEAIYRAEADPEVVSLCEQPYRILEPFDGQPYYTFDLGLTFRDGREVFYEVKPVSRLIKDFDGRELPKDWKYVEDWCEKNGKHCDVITDEQLKTDYTLIENWRYLLPFVRIAKENPNPLLEAELLKVCSNETPILFLDLCESVPAENASFVQAAVAHLLHQGLLEADLGHIDAGPQMVIRRTKRG